MSGLACGLRTILCSCRHINKGKGVASKFCDKQFKKEHMMVKTFAGNNLLGLGFLNHFSSIILGMIAFDGGSVLSAYTYLIGNLFFMFGFFMEFNHQQKIFKYGYYFMACVFAFFPIVGPIGALWVLYSFRNIDNPQIKTFKWFVVSVFSINVHPLVLLIWSVIFFVTFAIIFKQNDPYFLNVLMTKNK